MDEICLRKPPIHLEGEHLLKTSSWRGRNWEPKFFMVLGNTLSICENSSMIGSSLLDVEFDDIDICDGHVKHSRKKYVIQIQLNNGVKFNNYTEIDFAVESKEVFDIWSKGLVYAKYYWLKKSSVPSTVQSQIEDNSSKFLLDLVMYNGVTASIQLAPSSVFKDVVKQVNRSGGCYCKICEVSEKTAKLFVVNQEGKLSLVQQDEKIYNYQKDGCKFFLMEKDYRVLVVFFEADNGDSSFISFTAKKYITASEVVKIPQCRELIPKGENSGLTVYFYNDSPVLFLDIQLAGNDNVFDFLYDRDGNILTNTGKIIVRAQNGIVNRKCTLEDEGRMKAEAAKMRAKRRIQDDIQQSIEKEREQIVVPINSNNNSENNNEKDMIIDSEFATTYIQNIRGEIKTKPVVLSSGQVIYEPADVDDHAEKDDSDDEEDFTFPDQDPDDCLQIFVNPNAYKELFLNSAHSSSSELSTTDSMDNTSAILSSSFEIDTFIPPDTAGPTTVNVEETQTAVPNNDVDSKEKIEKNGMTLQIMEMYSDTVLEPVETETDENGRVAVVESVDHQIPDKGFQSKTGENKSDSFNAERDEVSNFVNKIVDVDVQQTTENIVSKQESQKEHRETQKKVAVDKKENIVLNKKSPKSSPKIKCQFCADLMEKEKKPTEIKTNILSFLNKTGQDQYLCLSGTHLRKIDEAWYAVDGCEVLSGFSDTEWKEAMESRKNKENLGNFVCLFVQARRGGKWFVRQMPPRSETPASPTDATDNHLEVEDSIVAPIESSTDNVVPDIVQKEETEVLDDAAELESSFEGSLEFARDNTDTTFTINTEKLKKNFTNIKESLQHTAQTIKATIPQMGIEKRSDAFTTNHMSPVTEKIKGKLRDAYDVMYDTISQISVDERYSPAHMDKQILSDEFITIDQSYVKPLKDAIFKICSRLESVQLSQQHQYGDDFQMTEIGWEVRGDFCTILANLLRVGMRNQAKTSLFSAPTSITLWELVKDFSLAFKRREFGAVIKTIKSSKYLQNDDQRFRFFFCELLNRSSDDGSDKLIVLFFQMFPMIISKQEKYYLQGSFWRMTYDSGFGVILDEILLSMRHFNGWPFNLHIDFEYRQCPRQQQDDYSEDIHEDSLVYLE